MSFLELTSVENIFSNVMLTFGTQKKRNSLKCTKNFGQHQSTLTNSNDKKRLTEPVVGIHATKNKIVFMSPYQHFTGYINT